MYQFESDEKMQMLIRGLLSLETEEECRLFLEDLCTVPELTEMSRRLYAAKMLYDNTVYTKIAEETHLSTATISRVNRCLKYGNGGYRAVLERMYPDSAKAKDENGADTDE